MRARKLPAAALTALAVLCGCGAPDPGITGTLTSEQTTSAPAVTSTLPGGYTPRSELLNCLYFDAADFNAFDSASSAYISEDTVQCGVAPHHLAAGHFIAGMYKTAARTFSEAETVVVIAPMHYDSPNTLCTTDKGWNTAFGAVRCDTDIAGILAEKLGAAYDDDMTEFDHSASSHIPFIKRYLPDAKAAVLLVSPRESRDFPVRLAQTLYELSENKNVFFAFSIDFSHYLTPDKAEAHDKETLEAVTQGDTAAIESFTNDNVDTPYCLSTFVRLSALLGAKITSADHGNTFTVGNMPYTPTLFEEGVTSYFVFLASSQPS